MRIPTATERLRGRFPRATHLVVLARRRADAETARRRAEALLRERGLALHPDKTHVRGFNDGFWFLGHYFIRNLVLRDLEHAPDAAPPVWELDAPSEQAVTARAARPAPKRPALAKVSETLRARTRQRRQGRRAP